MSFSFSFSGDDIEDDGSTPVTAPAPAPAPAPAAPATGAGAPTSASAFPVQGKPQLPPQRHDLQDMLAQLPSKIAFGLLDVKLDSQAAGGEGNGIAHGRGSVIRIPRRELWDVRVQLMAEDEGEGASDDQAGSTGELAPGLGSHDVKTGIYEGGFKSWESSVDLVKVLLQPPPQDSHSATPTPSAAAAPVLLQDGPSHVIELGCGTALPSLALFQWACACATSRKAAGVSETGTVPSSASGDAGSAEKQSSPSGPNESSQRSPAGRNQLSITVADYNPSVLYLVTLPNFLLAWALQLRNTESVLQQALTVDDEDEIEDEERRARTAETAAIGGELELTSDVKKAFCDFLDSSGIAISFLSGGWSPAFTELLHSGARAASGESTLILGAETIYSPFALEAFSETTLEILRRQKKEDVAATAIIGAKKLYFGVGGSLDDFVQRMRLAGVTVNELSEETGGVHRGVVQCLLE